MQVVGAFEKDNQKLPHTLTGKWDTALEALMADGTKQTIWKVHPLPKVTSRYWPPHKESGVSLCNPAFMLPRVLTKLLSGCVLSFTTMHHFWWSEALHRLLLCSTVSG